MSRLLRPLSEFWHLPAADKRQFILGFFVVLSVRLALGSIGYNRLSRLIPAANRAAPAILLKKLSRRIPRLAAFVPGATCLTQAVAAQFMLARMGYRSDMRIGVRQDATGQIRAHAWLLSEGRVILGGDPAALQSYSPLVDLSPRSS